MTLARPEHGSVEVWLPSTPPSFNAVGYRSSWRVGRRHKLAWQGDLQMLFLAEGLPKLLSYVSVTASLRFPVARRRDEGNYRVLLEKACGDALVTGGWLADDTPDRFSFGAVVFDSERGPAKTSLVVHYSLGGTSESRIT